MTSATALRSYVPRLTLALASTVVTLALVEAGFRAWVYVTQPLFVLDDELGWSHRANIRRIETSEGARALVETNALGLRGPLRLGPTTRRRILVLGDSFAEGRQVSNDESFSAVWERLDPEVEVINAGVMGYGTVQEALTLRRLEPTLRPAVVVVMVFRNDLGDNVTPFGPWIGPRPYADASGAFHSLDWSLYRPLLPPLPGAAWLYRHSVAMEVWQARRVERLRHKQLYSAYIDHWRRMPEDVKWHVLEVWLSALARDHVLVVVACPDLLDVRAGKTSFADRLGTLAKERGLEFVNLQDVLSPDDFLLIHWNRSGHEKVARSLASSLAGTTSGRACSG